MMDNTNHIYELDKNELENILKSWSEPSYRIEQFWQGIYKQLYSKPQDFSGFPIKLRERIKNNFDFTRLKPEKCLSSSDGKVIKYLFNLDQQNYIEAVLMIYASRKTLCISTQCGCGMGCIFCATGQMGFKRNLSAGEIIEQVIYFNRLLHQKNQKLTNIVLMGMGEPFQNYKATMAAIDRLNDPTGFNFGERRFTISTVGLVPMINQFTKEDRQINLAVSLHAADDELRSQLLPINKKYPINDLLNACKKYVESTNRRISFEWALIDNINDTQEQAYLLCRRINKLLCHVNILLLNPTPMYSQKSSTQEKAIKFRSILQQAGIPTTIRLRRGIDIQAGCGQLAVRI